MTNDLRVPVRGRSSLRCVIKTLPVPRTSRRCVAGVGRWLMPVDSCGTLGAVAIEGANPMMHVTAGRRRRFPSNWERAHAKVMFPVRLVITAWLCFISAVLIAFDRGELWLILLVPAIVVHLYIAYRIRPRALRP